ncbi:hypothetical protein AURDEDRAFT_114261 [Auricularia subglabra TFB-10046 SS5]|nr:hypothetical protein AURDEDRAFT_114261 [Auricularia subglabra TFB-10046 SS5]
MQSFTLALLRGAWIGGDGVQWFYKTLPGLFRWWFIYDAEVLSRISVGRVDPAFCSSEEKRVEPGKPSVHSLGRVVCAWAETTLARGEQQGRWATEGSQ